MHDRKQAALDYHEFPTPGKISITATKQLVNQSDLALAYSPGVAAACEAIVENPLSVFRYTARGNLVGVISNGTAVLGLGAIGPLAAKPVMEGKAVLFKKFAGIDVFDIEIEQRDPHKLIELIAALEPTFGAINLEDIKAPECFIVERELRRRMKIPVFHDDQHGTAITVGAAVLNGLHVVGKDISQVKLVVSGAGAAALACVDLLLDLGLTHANIWLSDLAGVVFAGRKELMDPEKARFAHPTDARTLDDLIGAADVFLGLSAAGVLTQAMYSARELAMTRMEEEADQLGADGIVGVRLDIGRYEWGADMAEFIAIGTAIKHKGGKIHRAPNGRPFTSDLSGQAFWTLMQTGKRPVGMVMGNCVYHVAHRGMIQSMRQTGQNVELEQYTQALYDARELAMERMQKEAEAIGDGVLGIVEVKLHENNHGWGSHVIEFFALGTAVVPNEHADTGQQLPDITPVLDIND